MNDTQTKPNTDVPEQDPVPNPEAEVSSAIKNIEVVKKLVSEINQLRAQIEGFINKQLITKSGDQDEVLRLFYQRLDLKEQVQSTMITLFMTAENYREYYEILADLFGMESYSLEQARDAKYSSYKEMMFLERCLDHLIHLNGRGNFDQAIRAIVEKFLNLPVDLRLTDHQSWSHCLCHLFEKYRKNQPAGKPCSFLNFSNLRDLNEQIIDNVVQKVIKFEQPACTGRIIHPLLTYNLDQMGFSDLNQEFIFRPAALQNPEFTSVMERQDGHDSDLIAFIEAKNLREYLLRAIRIDAENRQEKYYSRNENLVFENEAELFKLLEKLQPDLSREEIEEYFNFSRQSELRRKFGFDEAKANIEAANQFAEEDDFSEGKARGLFVDVDGTLIDYSQDQGNDDKNQLVLSPKILKLLESAQAIGKKIVIFTDGDPEAKTEQLRQMGLDEKFLPVQAKERYRSMTLETVVDDTHPEIQGFRCQNYFSGKSWYPLGVDEKGQVIEVKNRQ
jgi:hypothetical protein